VFHPAISPDNRRIAATSYSPSGYDISLIDLNATDWQPALEFYDTLSGTMNDQRRTMNEKLYYYNPFPTLLPAFWLPWASLSDEGGIGDLGAFTLGWDALQFHQYQLVAGYRFSHSSPFLTASYALSRYRPVVSALADLDLHRQDGSINVELPFLSTRQSCWLDFGLTALRDMTKSSDDSDLIPSGLSTRADLDWTYSDAHQYRFDVAPVEGRIIGLHTDAQSKSLFSDRDLARVLGYWYQYFGSAPQTWSLRSKLVIGTAFEEGAADAFVLDYESGLLGVRGYANASEPARSVVTAGLQFRTPLWWVERGVGTGPLFLQNINAAAFADAGLTSDWPSSTADCNLQTADSVLQRIRMGVGTELRVDLILSHLLPVSLYAGCGFGLNPLWPYRLYFGVSSSMLAGILNSPIATRQSPNPPSFRYLPEAL
jgi:hypothetical protein